MSSSHNTFGIIFDIDGVLLKDGLLVPGAKESIQKLHHIKENGEIGEPFVPYVFVTNSGGLPESERALILEKILEVPVSISQIIQSHTPMKSLLHLYEHKRVLVVGKTSERAISLAKSYGFKNILSIQEFSLSHPYLCPSKYKHSHHPTDHSPHKPEIHDETPINAIFVFEEPDDWKESIQIIVDVLRSTDGVLGLDQHPSLCKKNEQVIQLYVGNPDLVYAGQYSLPRFTMGAFMLCVDTLFKEVAGYHINFTYFGKPFQATYRYVESVLNSLLSQRTNNTTTEQIEREESFSTIYCIGDNVLSDIKGANQAGDNYFSILVKTGVFKGDTNDTEIPAKYFCEDVSKKNEFFPHKKK
eukprot:TRINITY_DN6969_c0_g1_i1.p1 TRINITY_DN6969_c0_g1~~TRINITY_DN6969_c0_g1_i1.p1  ORF type:complete len:376 (-),score=73.84 TRINITY_DN6969_c0_g1_i1:63-1133(-)